MTILRPDSLPDLAVVTPSVFGDSRGEFFELFNQRAWAEDGLNLKPVQTNASRSTQDVLRGLHYQWPNPQGKLVTCLEGEIWDVAVDIRVGSSTFGQYHAESLSADNHKLFWIPEGFAHGFLTLSSTALVVYHVTSSSYSKQDDRGIHYLESEISVPWPKTDGLIISEKDQTLPSVKEAILPHLTDLQALGFYR